jgi:hypothetical protein
LLKRENELLTGMSLFAQEARAGVFPLEIRELDSERQSLVYNHHHELIAASTTISAVNIWAFILLVIQ